MPTLGVLQPLPTGRARRVGFAVLPLAVLGLVAGLGALLDRYGSSLLVLGLLDEAAHLATAWLLLAAFLPERARAIAAWALLGAVAIDLDHVPLYLWDVLGAGPGARPVTHCLLTVAVLAGGAAVASPRLRTPLLGLALGTVLHLFRDLADGPGVPLLWPFGPTKVTVGYAVYLLVLAVAAAAATVRRCLPPPAR